MCCSQGTLIKRTKSWESSLRRFGREQNPKFWMRLFLPLLVNSFWITLPVSSSLNQYNYHNAPGFGKIQNLWIVSHLSVNLNSFSIAYRILNFKWNEELTKLEFLFNCDLKTILNSVLNAAKPKQHSYTNQKHFSTFCAVLFATFLCWLFYRGGSDCG